MRNIVRYRSLHVFRGVPTHLLLSKMVARSFAAAFDAWETFCAKAHRFCSEASLTCFGQGHRLAVPCPFPKNDGDRCEAPIFPHLIRDHQRPLL